MARDRGPRDFLESWGLGIILEIRLRTTRLLLALAYSCTCYPAMQYECCIVDCVFEKTLHFYNE